MQPSGRAQVEAAKADGRWDAAYDSPANAQVPADFLQALRRHKGATAFFQTLSPGQCLRHQLSPAHGQEARDAAAPVGAARADDEGRQAPALAVWRGRGDATSRPPPASNSVCLVPCAPTWAGPGSCSTLVIAVAGVSAVLAGQAELRRPQADARRRRHLVPHRRRQALVPPRRAAARRAARRHLAAPAAAPSSPSRTTASYVHPGVDPIALGRAVVPQRA